MATFLLRWNPAISSFTESNFRHFVKHFPFCETNWSIYDYTKASIGDDFYMMRVGNSKPGIVLAGRFCSEPTKMADWSGEGKVRFYCDLWLNFITDPDSCPFLSLEQLSKACPEVDWNHGHSGEILSDDTAGKLDELWKDFKRNNPELFNHIHNRMTLAIEPEAAEKIDNFEVYRDICSWSDNMDTLSEGYTHDCANLSFNIDYDKDEAHLRMYFMGGNELHITCSELKRIKCDLVHGYTAFDDFHISAEYTDLLHLKANGIDIVCGHICFDRVSDYNQDYIPICI